MLKTIIILGMLALAGAVHAADWPAEPDAVVPVRWVRSAGPAQFEVRDGVCVLYVADSPTGRILGAADLVRGCLERGGLRTDIPPGVLLLRWWRLESNDAMWRLQRTVGVPMPRRGVSNHGFYARSGSACNVATQYDTTLGHELKHCFDGSFHL